MKKTNITAFVALAVCSLGLGVYANQGTPTILESAIVQSGVEFIVEEEHLPSFIADHLVLNNKTLINSGIVWNQYQDWKYAKVFLKNNSTTENPQVSIIVNGHG
ncbi:MAG: hypothetical protein ATN36_05320 [Epulopiscium sp. Nele67-Bin005]|nr:MAG: hypothetical protein ATN36_05320 [Epulopiscium sp. Nele67-Bin005]